jgi:hypothetical protein
LTHDEGWVRVHSDADEGKSDEEFLTRNILMEFIEVLVDAPADVRDPELPEVGARWWEMHPEYRTLVNEYADKIAREFETSGS